MEKAPIQLIAFDVNGTLLDDRENFCNALNKIFVHFDCPELPELELRKRFSQPWINLYRDAGITEDQASEADFYSLYDKFYSEQPTAQLASGVKQTLEDLLEQGLILTIVSTQRNPITLPILQQADIAGLFVDIEGEVADKSESLQQLAEKHSLPIERVAYVGDQDSDMAFAKTTGALAVGYTQGLHPEEKLIAAGADVVFSDFAALPELL